MIINKDKILIKKLSEIYDLSIFDCGDDDINSFLKNDALNYQKENLATTTLFIYVNESTEKIMGFCTLASDCIKLKEDEILSLAKQTQSKPREFPAIKLARFGRDKEFKKNNVDEFILKYVIGLVLNKNEDIGVRFLTLDAYENKVSYYEQYGFVKNIHEKYKPRNNNSNTISMRLDLKRQY